MTTTRLELTETEAALALAVQGLRQRATDRLWAVAMLALAGVLTVPWVAFLGWCGFSLVAEVASWAAS